MDELGAEFLRVYDGRFNYREGHVVSKCLSTVGSSYVCDNLVCHVFSEEELVFKNRQD